MVLCCQSWKLFPPTQGKVQKTEPALSRLILAQKKLTHLCILENMVGPEGTLDGPSSRYITIKRTLPRHPKSNSLASIHSGPSVSLVHVALTEKNVASKTNFTVPTSSYESMPTWTLLDVLANHT